MNPRSAFGARPPRRRACLAGGREHLRVKRALADLRTARFQVDYEVPTGTAPGLVTP